MFDQQSMWWLRAWYVSQKTIDVVVNFCQFPEVILFPPDLRCQEGIDIAVRDDLTGAEFMLLVHCFAPPKNKRI